MSIVCHGCALSVLWVGTECAKGAHRVCHGCAISEPSAGDGRVMGDGPGPTFVQSMSKIDLSTFFPGEIFCQTRSGQTMEFNLIG